MDKTNLQVIRESFGRVVYDGVDVVSCWYEWCFFFGFVCDGSFPLYNGFSTHKFHFLSCDFSNYENYFNIRTCFTGIPLMQ